MCYYKSLAQKEAELLAHYDASFQTITDELEPIKERFTILLQKDNNLGALTLNKADQIHNILVAYSQKDALPAAYTKQELSEMKWCLKTLSAFHDGGIYRYMENGFDYLPTPIITAGDPKNFKLFRWGLIPFYMNDKEKAMILRTKTLNCISEEMYNTQSFKDAAKNAQRCLIPVSGFYEWRWLDDEGTVKIPWYVTFRDRQIRSMAGLYSRWKDNETSEYYYSYTVLTTAANEILEYVHNSKKRMPVFIAKENEQAWLNRDLTPKDVTELCHPTEDPAMGAYTISKLLTTRNINTNVPEVRKPMNYQQAIDQANQYLQSGDKKKALEAFKNSISGEKIKIDDLVNVANQKILAQLGAGITTDILD
ncbi:MAG TPA: SOS response-associated peptidase [Cyclobacteriaceae bacterium]|jgi:putative SOS response-associated peptidase YedK|nr:SOS response-associated peptidase [Cyclobacteriaceae bacterium]